MKQHSNYCIEFNSHDPALIEAGFDVCLALTTLDLPLSIIFHRVDTTTLKKLTSLMDYELATLYDRNLLTDEAYKALKSSSTFLLTF